MKNVLERNLRRLSTEYNSLSHKTFVHDGVVIIYGSIVKHISARAGGNSSRKCRSCSCSRIDKLYIGATTDRCVRYTYFTIQETTCDIDVVRAVKQLPIYALVYFN